MDLNPEEFAKVMEGLDADTYMLFQTQLMGEDAVVHIQSDLGKYMVGLAKQEYVAALIALSTVPWWRRRKIQNLQAQAWRAKSYLGWLAEAIQSGRSASQPHTQEE